MPRPGAERVADLLWGAALLLGTVALVAAVWPASARVPELPPAALVAPPSVRVPSAPAASDVAVRADVFAAGHVPPRARWAPPPVDTMPPGLAPEPAAAARAPSAIEPPRFYGTVSDAGGFAALLRFPGAPNAQLYRPGDRAGAWRVGRVAIDRVTVAAPGGTLLTLRLPSREQRAAADTAPVP
jgi:hypothetical protein